MNLTSIDAALQRIQSIERQFQSLMSYGVEPDSDFQKILNSKVEQGKDSSSVNKSEINELIDKYAYKNGLDADFVKAVINQESGFNPNATSKCGAMGLMQLMPGTAQGLGVIDAYDPEQNIEGGTKYLKGLMDRFNNNKSLALAAYNAGPNAVKKYGGIPPYQETQNYVKSVISQYDRMKGGKG
ncbi:lytic transglycosylase domain-containing protein [bacterium]|nr:lytic transglycosylase domain-containing protein [bacterium]MBR1775846.1 lytic transglycosylase domain-containing protein [bacterium]